MWPNSKGKGGKGSSKSNDGDDEKPRSKPRATRTKLKAMTAEAARALQDTGETSVKPRMSPEELLEAEIFRAAEQASADQVAREEQARASGPEFLKIPEKSASLDDQLSGVWKARLMGGNKPTPGQNTAIPSPANRVAMEAAERARTNAQHESMIGIVDRMFDQFQNLAYDFNQVASASDLELTWIRPSINRENVGNWHSGAQYISVFSGRISTRYWTLVVRGSFETITAHIIPADKLLTFNSAPANYMPMLEMMPYFDGAMVYWSAGPKQLKSEDIQQAARAVLDSLVQVAQEDVPPAKPIDLFVPPAAPTAAAPASTSFIEPNVSSLGGDIDYSERYRQHFSNDSSTNVGGNQPNSFPSPPGQYGGGTNTSASNSSVSNSSVNSFRQFPPSQPFNQASSQPLNQVNSQSSDDDWKPVVRSVRGAAGPQPLQPRPFQNVQSEPTSPATSSSVSNSSISSTSSPPSFSSSASPTPSPSSSSFPSSPSVPSTPSFAAPPGRGQNSSTDDGWRGVDVKGPGKPSTGGTSPAFKPAFPQLPTAPAVNSDSFAGGNSQSFSGQRPSGDDWNFVPVEKEQKWPEPKSTGAPPAVNFPSNLFADMPASLGFPASAASNSNNLLEPPKVESPPATEPSSNNFAKPAGNYPFSRPFSAKSAVKPAAAAGATPEPPVAPASTCTPAPTPTSAPVARSNPEFVPGPAPSPPASTFTPVKASTVQPHTSNSTSTSNAAEAAQDSDDNPFFTPLTPSSSSASSATYSALTQQASQTPGADTAGGVSPWAQAPAAAQGGNKADFNPTASSTQSHMIAPPPAPMPAKEPVVTSFFEPEIADDTDVVEETSVVDETSTVEIATTGQFSADRFAFDIANQAVPMPDLNQELSYLQPPAEVEPQGENTEEPADENQVEEPQSEELQSEEIQSLSDQEQQTPDALQESELEESEPEESELVELAEPEAETEAVTDTASEPELKIDSDPDSEVALGAEVEQDQEQDQDQELDSDSEPKADSVADQSPEELDSLMDESEDSQPLEELIESRVSEDSDELSESAIQENAAEDAGDFTSDNQKQLEQDDNLPSDDSSEEIADDLDDSDIAESALDSSDSDESDSDESELDDDELQETAAAEEAEEAEALVDEEQDLDQVLDSDLDSDVDSGQDADQELELDSTELELDRLAEIEEETVESIAELEQELAQTTEELHQSGFNSSEASQADHPWRGPDVSDGAYSDTTTEAGVESGTQFDQYSMPSFTPISTSLGTSAPFVVAANEHSLKSEIDRVITAFDKELELISTKGSDAFARRDLKGAEHMIKLAEMISEYKAGLAKLKDEYDQDLT